MTTAHLRTAGGTGHGVQVSSADDEQLDHGSHSSATTSGVSWSSRSSSCAMIVYQWAQVLTVWALAMVGAG